MPETGWMGGPLEPEPLPRPEIVGALLDTFINFPPEYFSKVADAIGAEEYEWNAAMGQAVEDLNAKIADAQARLREFERLTMGDPGA